MKKFLIVILTLALTATISHAQQQREGQRPNREKMVQMQVKRIAKALALVRKDLSVTHTIAELASTVGISKRTLEMKANLILGTTLKAEIDRIRLNEAVRLISNTNMSMQSIAERCGFCCASHLNTRFKTIFGHNPSVFRYQDPK